MSGEAKTTYPDFVFFHEADGHIVADLVDPQRPDIGDTGPKWTGLATYAGKHASEYRSIRAVIQNDKGELLGLDLTNPEVGQRLNKATNDQDPWMNGPAV
jgi:hypothetical protein